MARKTRRTYRSQRSPFDMGRMPDMTRDTNQMVETTTGVMMGAAALGLGFGVTGALLGMVRR